VKSSIKVFGITLFFLLGGIMCSSQAQSVYVTKTGDKYHKSSCQHLNDSKQKMEFQEALKLGYKACKDCKPVIEDKNKKSKASQCTAKTKSGERCKRETKNANGRCHQHQKK